MSGLADRFYVMHRDTCNKRCRLCAQGSLVPGSGTTKVIHVFAKECLQVSLLQVELNV